MENCFCWYCYRMQTLKKAKSGVSLLRFVTSDTTTEYFQGNFLKFSISFFRTPVAGSFYCIVIYIRMYCDGKFRGGHSVVQSILMFHELSLNKKMPT